MTEVMADQKVELEWSSSWVLRRMLRRMISSEESRRTRRRAVRAEWRDSISALT
jgi:hypothetical protein